MKYANLILDENVNMVNIGDYMQILAIENLYCHMGVDYDTVQRIRVPELNTYSGEKVILPLNYPMFGYYTLSEDITPVYLGISVMSGTCAAGLKCSDYQPIGCRDNHTYTEMNQIGLDAYCSGCMTLTFPISDRMGSMKKVFFVDIPDQLLPHIPEHLKKNAEYATHIFYNENCPDEAGVRDIYSTYINEASLVVTSKIHCAMPCLSAGIPVVFACKTASFRYNVLQGLIPVYTPEKYDEINWNPVSVEFEKRKRTMLEYAALRVESAFQNRIIDSSIHTYYQEELNGYFKINAVPFKNVTVDAFENYLKARYTSEDSFEYALWGVTQIAELTYNMVCKSFPKAKLLTVIDMFRKIKFHGIESSNTFEQERLKNAVVLVTAGAANPIAEEYFSKYKIKRHCVCYNGFHVEDGKRLDIHGNI